MAYRWGWAAALAGGRPWGVSTDPHQGFFESAQLAREHLQAYLDVYDPVAASLLRTAPSSAVEIIVMCPPSNAWLIYPVQDGISAKQAASFFYNRNASAIGRYLTSQRNNRITFNDRITSNSGRVSNSGCAVVAVTVLGAAGALAAAWARSRWGF